MITMVLCRYCKWLVADRASRHPPFLAEDHSHLSAWPSRGDLADTKHACLIKGLLQLKSRYEPVVVIGRMQAQNVDLHLLLAAVGKAESLNSSTPTPIGL